MSASLRATTTIEGNSVTLNVAAMTSPPPPPPPPLRVAVSRRGTVVTIKKGSIDITIDIPADATKPVVVNARGRVVCNGPAAGKGAKSKKGTKSMTDPPPPPKKTLSSGGSKAMTDPPPPPKVKSA